MPMGSFWMHRVFKQIESLLKEPNIDEEDLVLNQAAKIEYLSDRAQYEVKNKEWQFFNTVPDEI